MRLAGLAVLLALASSARATVIAGGDYAGTDLTPADGDVLSGTFLNVGLFSLPAGATVYVSAGVPLVVYASTVSIAGTLDASGRGQFGGAGGAVGGAGAPGFGGGSSGSGGGGGGATLKGGGGGAYGGNGGSGAGAGHGAGGALYDSTGVATSPLSADDVFEGSGGGGGGGGSAAGNGPGGSGGAGGGAVYIEASSMTLWGSVLLRGATAAAVTDSSAAGSNPAGGGGGSGGGLLLRIAGPLLVSGAVLNANGGSGGSVVDPTFCRTADPGGGGAGGRIKLFARSASFSAVQFSTGAGLAGGVFCSASDAPAASAGTSGSVSFGVIASSPTGFAAGGVYVTSISWTWSSSTSFGDAPSTSRAFRLFPATATAPLSAPEIVASGLAGGATVSSLTPNTAYSRFVTAYTDWGDSLPSSVVSARTLASAPSPAAPAFPSVGSSGLTAAWTSGSPANPSYTQYEVQFALDAGFTLGLQDAFLVGLSSSPSGLASNTTYYFRARAVNLDGVPSDFTSVSAEATLAQTPAAPTVLSASVSSASFAWSAGANPLDTLYSAEISSDNFYSLVAASATLSSSATFFSLTPGVQYFFRVRALNRAGAGSDYSAVVSTRAGVLSDTTPPSSPGTPVSDRAYSYDGSIRFSWAPAQSGVGILDYELLIGSFPGGNDVFSGLVPTSTYSAGGLASGRTYYAQVRARSNAGVVGPFSPVGVGVPVFVTSQAAPIPKPYAWPNPFNPGQGSVQIGFFLEAPGDVALRVYTLNGRLIRETSAHYGSAGNQVASWDGADGGGRRVAPGGYLVVVRKPGASDAGSAKVKVAVLY